MEVFETIAAISARMVVNRVSMKMKHNLIQPLIQDVRSVVDQKKKETE
jgi:ATP phosphoribosyltransferase